jgi:hypothetical protein
MINFLRKMVGKAPLTEQELDFRKWMRKDYGSFRKTQIALWEHLRKYFPDQVSDLPPKFVNDECVSSSDFKFEKDDTVVQFELRENSILVLSTEHSMSQQTAERLKESMKKIIDGEPGNKIAVLSDGLKLSVIHRDWMNESEKRAMRIEDEKLGAWMSAALTDPKSCQAFKDDINAWLETFHYSDSDES